MCGIAGLDGEWHLARDFHLAQAEGYLDDLTYAQVKVTPKLNGIGVAILACFFPAAMKISEKNHCFT